MFNGIKLFGTTWNFVFIPPANCVCGRVYCFHVVRPSVRLKRFVFLISLRVMDGISSNLAYTFISTGQIIIIKRKDEGPFL